MKVEIESGKYVVAVSGGVDSVVLLDLLSKSKKLDLVVAHFDHGMRKDSDKDCRFVEQLSAKYKLLFIGGGARLGKQASEEKARKARYDFLNGIKKSEKADAIITAHHQDDVIETIILNVLRGTGRKGITSLKNRSDIQRPLIEYSKETIKEYAKLNNLNWVEDPTNASLDYSRNWIRHKIIPKLSENKKTQLIDLFNQHRPMNDEIDGLLSRLFKSKDNTKLDRSLVTRLDYSIACELIAEWLRANELGEFDKKTIDRIVRAGKTLPAGKRTDIYNGNKLLINKTNLIIEKSSQSDNK